MRIHDTSSAGITPSATGETQRTRPATEQGTTAVTPIDGGRKGDQVQFSDVASHVSAHSTSIHQSVSAERAARIGQLTQLVQGGQYHPDPAKVADAMIRNMLSDANS